jgi:serine/threonine protein kinase
MPMQPAAPTLLPNTTIHERYVVRRTIGQGGMGAVYEASDERLGNTVALKQMLLSGQQFSTAFQREARLLAGLRHAALPKVTDYFTDAHGQFLVMEYIPGSDLGSLLGQRGRPFAVQEVLGWADQILQALEYLHCQQPPIVHRDIKPQNLKMTPGGDIVLLDFGLAKGMGSIGSQVATTASLFGYTPNYAPLEQIQGSGTGPASDLYALGATLHHLLTGMPPANALERAAAAAQGQPDPLRPAHELNPDVPPSVSAALVSALSLDPNRRPPSAAALRAALRPPTGAAAGVGPAYTDATVVGGKAPLTPPTPSATTSTRRPAWLWGLVGALVAALVVAGIAFAAMPPQQTIAPQATAESALAVASTDMLPTASAMPTEAPSATSPPTEQPSATALLATSTPLPPPTSEIRFAPAARVPPLSVSASNNAPPAVDANRRQTTFTAGNAVDGQSDTAWRVEGDGVGQYLQLAFARPLRVTEIQLIPGYAKIDPFDGTDRFTQNRRVKRVRFEFSDGSQVEGAFADSPTLQAIRLATPILTNSLRIVVLETLPPAVAREPRNFTPISEVVVIGEEQVP